MSHFYFSVTYLDYQTNADIKYQVCGVNLGRRGGGRHSVTHCVTLRTILTLNQWMSGTYLLKIQFQCSPERMTLRSWDNYERCLSLIRTLYKL